LLRGEATLDENMNWLADSLGRKAGQCRRRDPRLHRWQLLQRSSQTYTKRPIYWLFSSGKHKAFECLVYLHRYNEGTLARMRNEYVIPLAGKFGGRRFTTKPNHQRQHHVRTQQATKRTRPAQEKTAESQPNSTNNSATTQTNASA
jgi:hypothetical protein